MDFFAGLSTFIYMKNSKRLKINHLQPKIVSIEKESITCILHPMNQKRGRPAADPESALTYSVFLALTQEQGIKLQELARKMGVSRAAAVRKMIARRLGRPPKLAEK